MMPSTASFGCVNCSARESTRTAKKEPRRARKMPGAGERVLRCLGWIDREGVGGRRVKITSASSGSSVCRVCQLAFVRLFTTRQTVGVAFSLCSLRYSRRPRECAERGQHKRAVPECPPHEAESRPRDNARDVLQLVRKGNRRVSSCLWPISLGPAYWLYIDPFGFKPSPILVGDAGTARNCKWRYTW